MDYGTCSQCGTSNTDSARFCSDCGSSLQNGAVSSGDAKKEEFGQLRSKRRAEELTPGDPCADHMLGLIISGKYRLEARLGAGGMGAVYRATRLVIGDEVAVKILYSEQADPGAAERFRREAQAAARLKHSNVVTIHDIDVTDEGLQYLVMELVEGETLRQIVKQRGPLTMSAAAEIVNQVCGALDEAHRHNIIHRDIKPDNIIVDVTADSLRAKVLDFGIAKLRDDTAGNLTQTGSILGTPHYMSPEQCLGEELDKRSDIYSLGVVLYEMLTGLVPFNSPTSAAVVVQQVTQPPPSLRSLNPAISPAVEAVVLHALEKQRGARPQTAGELARHFSASIERVTRPAGSGADVASVGALFGRSNSLSEATVVASRPSVSSIFSTPANQVSRSHSHSFPFAYVAVGILALILGGVFVSFIKSSDEKAAPSLSPVEAANAVSTRNPVQTPTEALAPQNAMAPSLGLKPETIENLIHRWVIAQNSKDQVSYQSCYGVPFDGIKRTKTGRAYHYDFNSWMKDRWQMIHAAAGLTIEVKNLQISIDGDSATVEFDQYYRSLRYSDWGPKLLKVKLTPAGERIIYEELKASYAL